MARLMMKTSTRRTEAAASDPAVSGGRNPLAMRAATNKEALHARFRGHWSRGVLKPLLFITLSLPLKRVPSCCFPRQGPAANSTPIKVCANAEA